MGEVAREHDGVVEAAAGHDGRHETGAVQVARAVQHVGQVLVFGFEHVAVHAAHEVADDAFALALDTLEHHVLRAFADERVDHALGLGVGDVGAAPIVADGLAQNDGCLGKVRCQNVSPGGELGHRVAQLGGVGGVHLAVVGHDRVDHAQRLGVRGVQIADAVDLLRRAEEAGVHGVDVDPDPLPRVGIVLHDVGRVVHVPTREGGVAGEQPRRYRAHVAARGRKHGDGHAKRALPVPAQVVDGGDARDVVVVSLVKVKGLGVCHS